MPRRKTNGPVRATPVQEQLWLLNRLYEGTPAYNLPIIIRLRDSVDLAALDAAFEEIIRRHESLRTAFVEVKGQVWQEILPSYSPELVYIDLRRAPVGSRRALLQRELDREASTPFDLLRLPLVRLTAICFDDRDWFVAATFHHIVADAWSGVVFSQELRALLNAYSRGLGSPLPALPIQYADYADWQALPERDAERSRQLEYWREKLSGAVAPARFHRP